MLCWKTCEREKINRGKGDRQIERDRQCMSHWLCRKEFCQKEGRDKSERWGENEIASKSLAGLARRGAEEKKRGWELWEGCDREMVARLFPEPAAELIRLGAWRSGELRRGAPGSGIAFYGCVDSPAGLRSATDTSINWCHAARSTIQSWDLAS